MESEEAVMVIDKPHYVVKLHKALLEVDLKEGAKKKLEEALERSPKLRESLGLLFQTIIPLDVPLKDIESASVDKKGQVKIVIPSRRDIAIPLEENESRKLVEKMNELIPIEKARAMEELRTSAKTVTSFATRRAEWETEASKERRGRI